MNEHSKTESVSEHWLIVEVEPEPLDRLMEFNRTHRKPGEGPAPEFTTDWFGNPLPKKPSDG